MTAQQTVWAALGPSGCRAGKAQRKEFARLFANYAVKDALDKLSTLDAIGFSVGKVKRLPNGDVKVRGRIQRSTGKGVKLGFRVRDIGGHPRVVDILIEGYSVAIHYQGVFERRGRRNIVRVAAGPASWRARNGPAPAGATPSAESRTRCTRRSLTGCFR